jgi:hypothetical protein
MMIAVPEVEWEKFETQTVPELSRTLLEMAAKVNPARVRKHPRKPKKKSKKGYVSGEVARRHVSTARVLGGQEST